MSAEMRPGQWFTLDSGTVALIAAGAPAAADEVGRHLVEFLRPRSENVVRRLGAGESAPVGSVLLRIGGSHGAEGYMVDVTPERVTIEASEPAGLFYGLQTLRQMAPAGVEHKATLWRTVRIPAGRVTDAPRFTWRGAMLDVSRHFLEVDEVKRYIDLMALYKLNRLHLHLSDDQGWRIEIRSWPNLARHGGATEVGGGKGGYYTQAQYSDIVAYAAARHITVVPEIDMPGHTNAALSSYPELNCDGKAPPPYFGVRVGFSALCVEREAVTRFVDDVVRELAPLTPGPWIHLGGDEVEK
ncbi:MAG TPA: family 20 glycosylhydrolase, partial [Gemmatimonadaceae bacterium]|nr:family 20 glycosylhydrolase [Gemmatimonadaceae bacterium]